MYDNAKYVKDIFGITFAIQFSRDGITYSVPLDPSNTDYAAIMALVEAGELVIAPADE